MVDFVDYGPAGGVKWVAKLFTAVTVAIRESFGSNVRQSNAEGPCIAIDEANVTKEYFIFNLTY